MVPEYKVFKFMHSLLLFSFINQLEFQLHSKKAVQERERERGGRGQREGERPEGGRENACDQRNNPLE